MLDRAVQQLRQRWWSFFHLRCLVGFPWFWPARPSGHPAMLEARRLVRQHYGCEHGLLLKTLARIFVTVAWPPAVLLNLWQIRRDLHVRAELMRRAPAAFWAAMRHNVLPAEYFAYELWRLDRKSNIDNYLYL